MGSSLGARLRRFWYGAKRTPDRSKIVRCSYFGARLSVNLEDETGYRIALHDYERHEIAQMIEACRRIQPSVFLDVGANLGVYSCVLGHGKLVPRIIALEPDRENFTRLAANLRVNGLTGISEVHECAAGAKPGTAMLVPAGASDRGASRIDTQQSAEGAYAVEVAALDDIARLDGVKIAAKIDVSGSEIEVLMGAAQLFSRNNGYVQIEASSNQTAGVASELMAAFSWKRVARDGLLLRFEKP